MEWLSAEERGAVLSFVVRMVKLLLFPNISGKVAKVDAFHALGANEM